MLVGWIHGSYDGLLEWKYRHSAYAAGRVSREYRYSRCGEGDSEIGSVGIGDYVFSGCVHGSGGGWECRRCYGYLYIFGFHICHQSLYHVFIIAPLHLVVDDVLLSLSDLIDFIFWHIFFIFQFRVFAFLFMIFVA